MLNLEYSHGETTWAGGGFSGREFTDIPGVCPDANYLGERLDVLDDLEISLALWLCGIYRFFAALPARVIREASNRALPLH